MKQESTFNFSLTFDISEAKEQHLMPSLFNTIGSVRSIFDRDGELFQILILKDKIQQIYKNQIKLSTLINKTCERLKNNDIIDSGSPILTKEFMLANLFSSIVDFTDWISKFTKSINSIFKFVLNDLQSMVTACHFLLFNIHVNRFVKNRVTRFVVGDGVVINDDISLKFYGHRLTTLLLEFQSKLECLDLTENETALIYAFFMVSCNGNLINIMN